MYTQFYGLREKPFSLSPDPRYLFLSPSHREALAHLLYGIEQGEGFIAITGEVGTGKTTLCRTLLQRVESGTEIAFLFNPQLSGLELLQAINAELGLDAEGDSRRVLVDRLNRFLLARRAEGRRVLLVIDEAQNLEEGALEQVRLLSNLETDTEKLLQIILIGQPELDAMLEAPRLRQLRQRIAVRWRLRPLSLADTRAYVRHRLRIAAGSPREPFSEGALREIHRRSGGVPRLINLLCDRALLAGYAAGVRRVGPGLVARTEREMEEGAGGGGSPGRAAGTRRAERREGARRVRPGRRRVAARLAAAAGLVVLGGALGLAARLLEGALPPVPGAAPGAPPAAAAAAGPALEEPQSAPARAAEAIVAPVSAAANGLPAPAPEPDTSQASAEPAPSPERREAAPPAAAPLLEDPATAIARTSPAAAAGEALAGALAAWGRPSGEAALLAPQDVPAALAGEGLRAEPIAPGSLEEALAWDLPLLLELAALDGVPRLVAVLGVDATGVRVRGLAGGPRRVPHAALAAHLGGRGWVVWRDVDELPAVLRPGAGHAAADWLQGALAVLGLWRGPATGAYDAATIAAVRAFQAREGLSVDGTVGPRTKARLYARLPTYDVPRLGALELAEVRP